MKEWTVDELKAPTPNALATGPFGSAISSKHFTATGVPVIRGGNLSQDVGVRLNEEGLAFLEPEKATEFSRSVARRGDLVFTCWGTIDQVGYIDERASFSEYVVSNKQMKLTPDPNKVDGLYLYYYFSQPTVLQQIVDSGIGSSVPGFNLGQLRKMRVRLPSLETQRKVVRQLDALDARIELNRRMSQTLEAMAQAIYKSWFVDFGPLHALSDGLTRDEVATAFSVHPRALRYFDTELIILQEQQIPMGWRVSSLGSEVKTHGGLLQTGPFGSQLHASDYVEEGIPIVMPQDMVGRRVTTDRIARVPEQVADSLSRHKLRVGDIVYSRRGDVERHVRVTSREAGWLCGTGCLLVRMGDAWPSHAYLSELLNDRLTREWIVRHAVGATMPNLNTSILSAMPLLVPPVELLQEYERAVSPLMAQQEALSAEAESLAQLRNELLPRLLSGELVVS